MDNNSNNNQKTEDAKIIANGQYIKDLSFENPQAPQIYTKNALSPKISISIDINATKLQEAVFEVELIINSTATLEDKKIFIIELTYAGIFNIKDTANEEELKEILFINCPSLLFPYARRIISDITRDASLPPLILNSINFKDLYESKKDSLKKIK